MMNRRKFFSMLPIAPLALIPTVALAATPTKNKVFYLEVGNLSKRKAEQYLKEALTRIKEHVPGYKWLAFARRNGPTEIKDL